MCKGGLEHRNRRSYSFQLSRRLKLCTATRWPGAILGGGKGAIDAIKTKPLEGIPDTTRLRINRLLNTGGKTGRMAGNSLGVLGLFFSSFESSIGYFTDHALPDSANSILAGK
jgi:mitochondrial import inner membrane translocase subunit TIM23